MLEGNPQSKTDGPWRTSVEQPVVGPGELPLGKFIELAIEEAITPGDVTARYHIPYREALHVPFVTIGIQSTWIQNVVVEEVRDIHIDLRAAISKSECLRQTHVGVVAVWSPQLDCRGAYYARYLVGAVLDNKICLGLFHAEK